MDLVADYARIYGGVPRPEQPWHEVIALASRVTRFDLREKLRIADGTALGQPVSEAQFGARQMLRAQLDQAAQ